MAGGSQSLYRKYRPRSFDEAELVGQEAVARTLRNAIQSDRVAHAYLFCGPRGTGKTSTARLLAKAVNCEAADANQRPCNACAACQAIGLGENRSLDIIEIDAASNRGIDDIRELRDKINFSPSQLRYKFYIIDEVHQLSEAASNALLKTLEEPPPHAKFVLATTDPQKVLETIVSRCQLFRFRRIPLDRMVGRLRLICQAEGLTVDDEALVVISRQATGSLRDALGLLDKVTAYGDQQITVEIVEQALGIHGDERVVALVDALLIDHLPTALETINAVVDDGAEPRLFTQQVVEYLRELLLRLAGGAGQATGLAPLRETAIARQVSQTSLALVADLIQRLSSIDYALERGAYGALPLELTAIEASLARRGLAAPGLTAGAAPSTTIAAPASAGAPSRAPARTPRAMTSPGGPAAGPPPAAATPPSPTAAHTVSAPSPAAAPSPATPALPSPSPLPDESVPPGGAAASAEPLDQTETSLAAPVSLEPARLADLWSRVMRQVNARHKMTHALLREAEPLLIDGDALILMVAYEFHFNKLRQDDVRQLIEAIIEEQAGRHYRLECVMASNAAAYQAQAAAPVMPAPPEPDTLPGSATDAADTLAESEAASAPSSPMAAAATDEARLRAAMNIFGARPVDSSGA